MWSVVLASLAAVLWASWNLSYSELLRTNKGTYGPIASVLIASVVLAIIELPVLLLLAKHEGGVVAGVVPTVNRTTPLVINQHGWFLAVLCVLAGSIASLVYAMALKLEPSKVTMITALGSSYPAIVYAVQVLLNREQSSLKQSVGVALVILGLVLVGK